MESIEKTGVTPYERAKPIIDSIKDDPAVMHFLALLSVNYLAALHQNDKVADIAREAVSCLETNSRDPNSSP